MQDTLRAFIALMLPEESVDILAQLQVRLRGHGLKLSWVKPRNLHLTMKFLGDVQAAVLPELVDALEQSLVRKPSLKLSLQGMGVFPGIKRPRVLWTGLGGDIPLLQSMFTDMEDGLAGVGFNREKRAFKAHITLARIRKRLNPRRLLEAIEDVGQFAPQPFVAERMALFKSDLKPSGAVYTPLAQWVLDG